MATVPSIDEKFTFTLDAAGDITLVLPGISPNLANVLSLGEISPSMLKATAEMLQHEMTNRLARTGGVDEPLRIRASSKHLSMASSYFRGMIRADMAEATQLRATGHLEIEVEDANIAFVYFLLIVHGRNHVVPRHVSYKTLLDMALLVDYYGCRDAVSMAAELWMDSLTHTVREKSARDMVGWVFIAITFRRRKVFYAATKALIEDSAVEITPGDLPIRPKIIDDLNKARETHLESLFTALGYLHETINRGCIRERTFRERLYLRSSRRAIMEFCSVAVQTAYEREAGRLGFLRSAFDSTYTGFSISGLLKECNRMKSFPIAEDGSLDLHDGCTLQARMVRVLDDHAMPKGLGLGEYDSVGDVALLVHNVPHDLPPKLEDLDSDVLSGPNAKTVVSAASASLSQSTPRGLLLLRASSKHLMLASPFFERMFMNGLQEGTDFSLVAALI
ncbi:hypothetical protein BJY04DRAFT_221501 [Aspergillus karnatakaensis]|uniref:uncharacterized protein n=1 Tax=Aspergillus karnatakaensis TaxID=1810916 RepID=UPI003CCDEE26